MVRTTVIALVAILVVGGCGVGPSGATPVSTASRPSSSGPVADAASGSPRPTVTPTFSAAAIQSKLPGLADWTVISPQAVDIAVVDGAIELTLTRRALWFQGQRGVLVGQPVTGDFRITATVRATDRTGLPLRDRTDGLVQLGGLMARADNDVQEDSVFIVVGTDPDGLSVETKSTTNSVSRFDGPDWSVSEADLRLCRSGATFTALKRVADAVDEWTTAATWDRPDLPTMLQVGPNVYSSGRPDLRVRYEDLRIERIVHAADCATP